jgi:uncharacterized membrane protein YfcA
MARRRRLRVPARADHHTRRRAAPTRTLARARQPTPAPPRPTPTARTRGLIWTLSLAVGTVGGIYGIGGGSLLAPTLLAAGYSAYQVAPATLTATFMTSIAGIISYQDPPEHPRRRDRP